MCSNVTFISCAEQPQSLSIACRIYQQLLQNSKWISVFEIISEEAGEWTGSLLGNRYWLESITKFVDYFVFGGFVYLCIVSILNHSLLSCFPLYLILW